jgi:aspartyl-tRNA(Asn)/glutamyl-tRNA(Gln) amidotransferase subunit A
MGKKVRLYNLLARFTTVFSMAGVPALSVPSGITNESLPVGLELIGRPLDEYSLFKVGEHYERATKFHAKLKEII